MKRVILALVLIISVLGLGAVGARPAAATCSMAAYSPYTVVSGTLRGQFRISGCGRVQIQVCVLSASNGATYGCKTQYTDSYNTWYASYDAAVCWGKTWAWANGYGVYTSYNATCW